MGHAMYRKYRSKSLDEVVGQEHITSTLQNALKTGRISHAYLFTGPKGVGKTSIARILAHEVNGLPYDQQNHLDIIEIDAASNRRIDEIRDLRDKVHIAPTSAKYKVYIIDEVHMLTKEAFNALLKTLEEPPEHVIFILATTEAHKLPETIISRTQRYTFRAIDNAKIIQHLETLATKEKITIDRHALELIASHSSGSLRDAISMLDQLSSKSDQITKVDVEHMLGIAPSVSIVQLAELLKSRGPKELLNFLHTLEEQGVSATQLAHQLSEYLRQQLLETKTDAQTTLILLEKLLTVASASNPARRLELILLHEVIDNGDEATPTKASQVAEATTAQPKIVEEVVVKKVARPQKMSTSKDLEQLISDSEWQKILAAIKQRHNTLYGIVRMAEPKIDENKLVLCFRFPFHQKQMNESKNQQLMQDVIADTTGKSVAISCIVMTNAAPPSVQTKQTEPNSDTLGTITDIFGGGEVLES